VNVSIRRLRASLDLLRLGRTARSTSSGDGSVVDGSVATLDAFDGRSDAAGELESVTLLLALLVFERNLALTIVLIVIRRITSAPQRSVTERTSTTTFFLRLCTRFGTKLVRFGVNVAPESDDEVVGGVTGDKGGEGVGGVEGADFDGVGDDLNRREVSFGERKGKEERGNTPSPSCASRWKRSRSRGS
jgi:hypothetical protein